MKIMQPSQYKTMRESPRGASARTGLAAACILCSLLCFLAPVRPGLAAEISPVNVKQSNSELYVSASVKPGPKLMEDMDEGLSKEFTFYVDLFRMWSIWPDEFVLGKKITRVLRSNQIKREYVATSIEGNVQLEKRFKDLESMVGWTLTIEDLKLTNIKELEKGTYFVKVTVESRIRKLPPVVGYLLFFVPEKEFSMTRNSPHFPINPRGH